MLKRWLPGCKGIHSREGSSASDHPRHLGSNRFGCVQHARMQKVLSEGVEL